MGFKKMFAAAFLLVLTLTSTVQGSHIDFLKEVSKAAAPHSKQEFCTRLTDKDTTRWLLNNSENLPYYTNYPGGIMDGGVCWWHSRFTRAAAYLAVFLPEAPKPTREEAIRMIKDLSELKQVVEIPGYKNLNEFSKDWWDEIAERLEAWQIKDGVWKNSWVNGLAGKTHVNAAKLKQMMDGLYHEVEELGHIAYTKMQLEGIEAHALLIYRMEKTNNGYLLGYIDSNNIVPESYSYVMGYESLTLYGGSLLYLERTAEIPLIEYETKKYCDPKLVEGQKRPRINIWESFDQNE